MAATEPPQELLREEKKGQVWVTDGLTLCVGATEMDGCELQPHLPVTHRERDERKASRRAEL